MEEKFGIPLADGIEKIKHLTGGNRMIFSGKS